MTRRGNRKKQKRPKYPGGLDLPFPPPTEYPGGLDLPFPPPTGEIAKVKGKAHARSVHSSGSLDHAHAGTGNASGSRGDIGKGKGIVHAGSVSPSVSLDSLPEEFPNVTSNKRKPNWSLLGNLPLCPRVSRMHAWSREEFVLYDKYLIEKWRLYGLTKADHGYLSIRDKNSKISHIARVGYGFKH